MNSEFICMHTQKRRVDKKRTASRFLSIFFCTFFFCSLFKSYTAIQWKSVCIRRGEEHERNKEIKTKYVWMDFFLSLFMYIVHYLWKVRVYKAGCVWTWAEPAHTHIRWNVDCLVEFHVFAFLFLYGELNELHVVWNKMTP